MEGVRQKKEILRKSGVISFAFDQSSCVERVTYKETFQGLFLPFSVLTFQLSLVFGLHSRGIKHYVYVLNLVIVSKKGGL